MRLARNATGVASTVAVASFGECEDHLLPGSGGANVAPVDPSPASDAGDAPIPYPPAGTKNVLDERLGSAIDGDANAPVGFPTAGDAAWNDDGAEDDGIVRLDGLRPGANATLLVRGTNPAGKVEFEASLATLEGESPRVVFSVLDRGTGISPEVAENLFDPFITTKTAVGCGLGLTMARHSIRNLGGDVDLEPRAGGGTVAKLWHPVA